MVELFQNIGVQRKKELAFWVSQAFAAPSGYEGAQMLIKLRSTATEEEKEFIDFAFEVEMEKQRESEHYSN